PTAPRPVRRVPAADVPRVGVARNRGASAVHPAARPPDARRHGAVPALTWATQGSPAVEGVLPDRGPGRLTPALGDRPAADPLGGFHELSRNCWVSLGGSQRGFRHARGIPFSRPTRASPAREGGGPVAVARSCLS